MWQLLLLPLSSVIAQHFPGCLFPLLYTHSLFLFPVQGVEEGRGAVEAGWQTEMGTFHLLSEAIASVGLRDESVLTVGTSSTYCLSLDCEKLELHHLISADQAAVRLFLFCQLAFGISKFLYF